jgi:hypothetical protein
MLNQEVLSLQAWQHKVGNQNVRPTNEENFVKALKKYIHVKINKRIYHCSQTPHPTPLKKKRYQSCIAVRDLVSSVASLHDAP